jgi:rfaE bifunctional protein kinase chain/domain
MKTRKPKALVRPQSKYVFRSVSPSDWDRTRLRAILRSIRNKNILVIGDVGVDRYTVGSVERISPEAPVPIVFVESEQLKLGLAANVADNVKVLGGIPLLVGTVGRDRGAQDFRGLLRKSGIPSTHLVVDSERRTVLKERVVSDRQQLLRIDYESIHELSAKTHRGVMTNVRRLLRKSDAVILEDYAKGLIDNEMAAEIFRIAKKAKKLVSADPNSKTPLGYYKGAQVLTPNTKEASSLSGIPIRDEDSLARAGQRILKQVGAMHVVITRGREGMAIFSQGTREVTLIPTYAREVYDVSGAGDTVIAVMTLALSAGATIEEASVLGNLAAGVEVGKRGTATVTPDEIQMALDFFSAARQ